ncbi:hypothetical protein [Agrobacterium rosae]|uniref:hypothetical protein n=1 Tax=Agrobacterium rosae TaxID=1972867 RepID=UPI0020340BAA|nr:hypothetical protein [Agrobacterium rosae]MCM2431946.1 hypothetical protein [Agrobacterium rosae]
MTVFRNKKNGDLVDGWMHSSHEDMFAVQFPNWVHELWNDGGAFTDKDGNDFLKNQGEDILIPDGDFIVRETGGVFSVVPAEEFHENFSHEG